jgi:hypothetical protein
MPQKLTVYYPAYSFLSGIGLDHQLRNAISTKATPDSMWIQLMFMDEACMYDLYTFGPLTAF